MKKFSDWMKKQPKKKPAVITRTCNRCNAERPSTVTFCPNCGSPEFRVEKKK